MSDKIDTPGKAIAETNSLIGAARAGTRKRKNWGYIEFSALREWAEAQNFWPTTDDGNKIVPATDDALARMFFGVKLDATVKRGGVPRCSPFGASSRRLIQNRIFKPRSNQWRS